ncbi:MAG: hypothetical protein ACRC62_22225 [Microcoleus sp.]
MQNRICYARYSIFTPNYTNEVGLRRLKKKSTNLDLGSIDYQNCSSIARRLKPLLYERSRPAPTEEKEHKPGFGFDRGSITKTTRSEDLSLQTLEESSLDCEPETRKD